MDNRVLFLDIDGVLNHETFYRARHVENASLDGFRRNIDKVALFCLYGMMQDANESVDIVLSSTWRHIYSVEKFNIEMERDFGISLNVIDATGKSEKITEAGSNLVKHRKYTLPFRCGRAIQIVNWLSENPKYNIVAALDDDSDICPEILVKTNHRVGFNALTVDALMEKLQLTEGNQMLAHRRLQNEN